MFLFVYLFQHWYDKPISSLPPVTEASQTDVHGIFCGCLKAQKEGARRSVLCDLDQCTRISGIRLPVDKVCY